MWNKTVLTFKRNFELLYSGHRIPYSNASVQHSLFSFSLSGKREVRDFILLDKNEACAKAHTITSLK